MENPCSTAIDPYLCERFIAVLNAFYVNEKGQFRQSVAARALGVSGGLISDICRHQKEPSKRLLKKVDPLGYVDGQWLFTGRVTHSGICVILQDLRERYGASRAALAECLHIPLSFVEATETARVNPSMLYLRRITSHYATAIANASGESPAAVEKRILGSEILKLDDVSGAEPVFGERESTLQINRQSEMLQVLIKKLQSDPEALTLVMKMLQNRDTSSQ